MNIFSQESFWEVSFPGIVEAFKFIALNNAIAVSIAVGVIEWEGSEELVGTYGWDFFQSSLGIIIVV